MTAYRCRTHPGEEVTWRGTGCRECGRPERRPRKRAKASHTDTLAVLPPWAQTLTYEGHRPEGDHAR